MIEMLSLKSEDKGRLNSHALKRFNDWQDHILSKAPQLRQLSIEQIRTDLNTYLHDSERVEFNKCLTDITRWLSGCMDTGDSYFPYAYDTRVIDPMSRVESLIISAYQRAEAERRKKEYEDRWCAAFVSINPPVDDAKKYLNDKEQDEFTLAVGKAIDAYLQKGEAYLADVSTFDYSWWLKKIQERKKEEAQKLQAIRAADEYNHRLNQEIVNLTSRLDHKQRDLASYFRAKIQDKRYTNHNFHYVLSKEDEMNFDGTLVSVANKRLEQLRPEGFRQFIVLPSQYYRRYYPLPSASYSFEEVPSLDFSFDIFAAAYAEVWLGPEKRSFDEYEFLLPWIEERNGLALLEKPRFLAYHYLILRPEDLDGYVFWESIPLVLLKGLLNGETRPDGCTILAASDSVTTYRIQGVEEEVDVPDKFVEYLKSIGSIDKMVGMGVMTEKVGNIVKAALGELEVKRKIPPAREKAGRRDSMKERAFRLFDEGKRPGDSEVKALGIKPNSAYRYYQDWKKACSHSQS
ncbi:MAG: hypothetical protein WBE46_06260 [Dehalococcoidia bacterium]